MIFYKINGKIVLSKIAGLGYEILTEEEAKNSIGTIYSITNMSPSKSRKSFAVTHPSLLFLESEGLELLKKPENHIENIPLWLQEKINKREVKCVNTAFPDWESCLTDYIPKKWTINIVGLGDVGGNLAAGLRLTASEKVNKIGIFDSDNSKIKRWHYEAGQIYSPSLDCNFPEIIPIEKSNLFDCDMFVFCVSVGVPEVGKEPEDVRIAQFEGNAEILKYYSKLAREKNYKGLFIVMSDPVDLLCNIAFNSSNSDSEGNMDYRGLAPEQIRGYGLGVMHGRAAYFAEANGAIQYKTEGRCFGPHGEGVVVADSIKNYNKELSEYLTDRTKNANLDVRTFGFKPYIAPAFSSGVLSFIETFHCSWNYSATSIGGVFIGSLNRLLPSGVELETNEFPKELYSKLEDTYDYLSNWYKEPIFHM
ncbi:lactate dehydrogenase [Candidatus Clostridium stratigraminis]|uniref:Lactate dehydrogenase n=1 Tax=Candidatus Clostridium stratigraminis TaxID=3381661 RepID=A0ABW8T606_9CLOT